ncbi:hypothetical protein C6P40_004232, partial [Pichia californica]
SFIKIFELIKYLTKENLNFKKKIIEFIINGLRIGCCENFIKLSSLIFKLNCDDGKNWNIGNFEIQLSLIIDKYENSLLLTKLLILDTMNSYYKILNDEKIKNMIKLAFKQEIKCNNIEIKQRSFEYYNLINLNIEIDNEITIKNILKLPNLLINNKIQLSKNWEDGYIRLLRFDQGIFFNNEKIKILFRIKRFKGYSVIEFNYKLMNDEDIKGFKFNLINNKNEFYDIKIIEYNDKDKNGNLIIKYSLKEMYSINDEPIIQIYIPSINEYINLKLSLALKSLYINDVNGNNNSNNKMSIQTFQSRWNQIGKFMFSTGCYKNEISNPVNIDNEGLSHTVELITSIRRGFSASLKLYKQYIPNMSLEYTVERGEELVFNANKIKEEVLKLSNNKCKLICVSKLHPASDIKALYDVGYREFGENYVQELIEKAKILPNDIKWHFIGGLQSNKCKDLTKNISNLYIIETIDSIKKAKKLNDSRKQIIDDNNSNNKIKVLIQVNTSGEIQKSGCQPGDELNELVKYIINECEFVEFDGLMTIGSYLISHSEGDNKEFSLLYKLRDELVEEFQLNRDDLQLSMGMSGDYKQAIKQGSTSVRVGSSIFGSRPPNNGH